MNDYAAVDFLIITSIYMFNLYFNLVQHVSSSTHGHGHTLDLVLTLALAPDHVIIEDSAISDHKSNHFNVQLALERKKLKGIPGIKTCIA